VLVSIIIPTFNRRAVVRDAVASVCTHGGSEFETVVVDDVSTDGTPGRWHRSSAAASASSAPTTLASAKPVEKW
jgi:glycosyltransferase involved in cell wall biosynthesis